MADNGVVALGIVSVLTTLTGSMGGIWLGASLQRRNVEHQWWLSERRTAFAGVLTAIDRFQFRLMEFERQLGASQPVEAQHAAVEDSLERLDSSLVVLQLLLPNEDTAVIRGVLSACINELSDAVKIKRLPTPVSSTQDAYAQILEMARRSFLKKGSALSAVTRRTIKTQTRPK